MLVFNFSQFIVETSVFLHFIPRYICYRSLTVCFSVIFSNVSAHIARSAILASVTRPLQVRRLTALQVSHTHSVTELVVHASCDVSCQVAVDVTVR